MDRTRNAARRLVAKGLVEISQGGRAVEPSRAKGPIRIKLA
jgi:DNA-binding FadR family transcriptional regulator